MSGGFGQHPFGTVPFGEAPWGRMVRFGLLPAIYRDRDRENGDALQLYSEGVRRSYDELRRDIRALPLLRDPLRVPGPERTLPIVLGSQVLRFRAREQYGVDGSVGALRQFTAPSARFSASDRGKYLTVSDSTLSGNNVTVQVASVVDATTVLTSPALLADAGPIRWQLRDTVEGAADHVVLEVMVGDVGQIRPGWVLFDGSAEYEVVARAHFPNRQFAPAPPVPLVDAQGDDGSIDAQGRLVAPSMTATMADVGRPVVLFGSTFQANRGKFILGPPSAPGTAKLLDFSGEPAELVEDSGPLSWAFLPRPHLTLRSSKPPGGTVEQRGDDATISLSPPVVNVTALSGSFVVGRDEGKVLVLFTPDEAFPMAVVQTVVSSTELEVVPYSGAAFQAGANQSWQLRALANTPDGITLEARAPSLLPSLAADFGLTVDRQEAAFRQRAWVRHVAAWTLLKGTDLGYETVGRLSGATVTPTSLFRINTSIGSTVPADRRVEYQEWAAGRSGADGSLSLSPAGLTRFYAQTAAFKPSDQDRLIRISGASDPANNRLLTIVQVVDARTVDCQPEDGMVLPELQVSWNVSRLYATEPPKLPRYDDFNSDLMSELLNGYPAVRDVWSIDRWCWEAGVVDWLPVTLTARVQLYPGRFRLTLTGRPDVVTQVGRWKIVDSDQGDYYLEALPVQIDGVPTFTVEVGGLLPPALGAARLQYVCPVALACDYCAASVVLLTIEADQGDNPGPQEVERFSERLLQRLEEVRPEHVTLIPRFTGELEARFEMTATIEAHTIGADLYAAWSPNFDEIPADVIPADQGTLVTIEVP